MEPDFQSQTEEKNETVEVGPPSEEEKKLKLTGKALAASWLAYVAFIVFRLVTAGGFQNRHALPDFIFPAGFIAVFCLAIWWNHLYAEHYPDRSEAFHNRTRVQLSLGQFPLKTGVPLLNMLARFFWIWFCTVLATGGIEMATIFFGSEGF